MGKEKPRHRKVLYWSFVCGLWSVIFLIGLVGYYAYQLPDLDRRVFQPSSSATLVLDRDGQPLSGQGHVSGGTATLDTVSPYLTQAVLAIEDRRFFNHYGIDPAGIARAMWVNIRAGQIRQGGSTITQQLAKNLFLTPEKSLKRKIQELLIAFWLESEFTKQEILEMYLNKVYLGAGTYGMEAASMRYFGHSASDVTLYEAAMLAGLLKAPSRYAPTASIERARERADRVIDSMVDAGFLDEASARQSKQTDVSVVSAEPAKGDRYFLDWVLDRIDDYVGTTADRITVLTSLDSKLQRLAEDAVNAVLDAQGSARKAGQAGMVVLTPHGEILAMVGGRSYSESQFNRASQALRQPGSAFKPFVYLTAMEQGLLPDDIVMDGPFTLDGWKPRNYSGTYAGMVTLRHAFAHSLNTATVRVSENVGRENVVKTARRLGITSELPAVPSIALGTASVRLIEMTAAYATFANGGQGVIPHGIRALETQSGETLYRRAGSGFGQIIDEEAVRLMNGLFTEVMASGTGKKVRLDRPAGGKTGTSQNFRDAYFIGFTADLVVGVWVGNDDGTPMNNVTGSGLPAEIWARFMKEAHRGIAVAELPGLDEANGQSSGDGFLDRLLRAVGIRK